MLHPSIKHSAAPVEERHRFFWETMCAIGSKGYFNILTYKCHNSQIQDEG
jgi:hypothetical protein